MAHTAALHARCAPCIYAGGLAHSGRMGFAQGKLTAIPKPQVQTKGNWLRHIARSVFKVENAKTNNNIRKSLNPPKHTKLKLPLKPIPILAAARLS